MSSQDTPAITLCDGGVTVDASLVAEKLGLPIDAFWRDIKRGIVYSVVERGEDQDAGKLRLTFRCRSRSCTIIIDSIVGRV